MKLHSIFEDPKKTKTLKRLVLVVVIVLLIIDIFMPRHHAEFPWDDIPGFSAVYGLISCVVIIVVSKALGKIWLQKKEDYYD